MMEHKPPQAVEPLSRFVIALSFAGALVFLYLRTFLLPAIPFVEITDQTLFFARAARMVHGQVLYRDFFELVTPGTDLIYAAAFRLFGIHAWLMQAWGIFIGLALFSVIALIARRILHGALILLPPLLFLVYDFNNGLDMTHHWYSTLASLAAVNVLMGGASLRRILTAGSLCGIATLFTQTQGVLTFAALTIYLLWLSRSEGQESGALKRFAALALPFVALLSLVLGYYVHKAGFQTLFFDLIEFPLRYMSSAKANQLGTYLGQIPAVHRPGDIIRLIPILFIYVLVPYIYVLGCYRLWRTHKVLPANLLQSLVLLHLVGLALFLSVANGPRFFRLCTVAPPAILICTWLISHQSAPQRLTRNLLWSLVLIFAVLFPIFRQTQWHAVLDLPIGKTAFRDIEVYREFQWLAQRTHPSDFFFNNSALSLYLSLDNPTASEFLAYDETTRPEQADSILQSIQRHPPQFIVLLPESGGVAGVHDHAAPLRRYVHDNYHLAKVFSLQDGQDEQQLWEREP